MFKEMFTGIKLLTKINERMAPELTAINDLLQIVLRMGVIKVGRKKFERTDGTFYTRQRKEVGIELYGSSTTLPDKEITMKNFIFDSGNKDEFKKAAMQLCNLYAFSGIRENSFNSKTGKYRIGIIDLAYRERLSSEDPKVIWDNWFLKHYDSSAPDILNIDDKSGTVKWFGSTIGGYPSGLNKFYRDYNFKETDAISGDGAGHSIAEVKGKSAKEFYDLLRSIGAKK